MKPEPTTADLLAEARDELKWRRWVYPRRATDGAMKAEEMTRKIALQEAIVAHLQRAVEEEIAAGDLFRRREFRLGTARH